MGVSCRVRKEERGERGGYSAHRWDVATQQHVEVGEVRCFEAGVELRELVCRRTRACEAAIACVVALLMLA